MNIIKLSLKCAATGKKVDAILKPLKLYDMRIQNRAVNQLYTDCLANYVNDGGNEFDVVLAYLIHLLDENQQNKFLKDEAALYIDAVIEKFLEDKNSNLHSVHKINRARQKQLSN